MTDPRHPVQPAAAAAAAPVARPSGHPALFCVTRGAAVLAAGALVLSAAVTAPSSALAEPSGAAAVQNEEDTRPVLSGRDTTILHLRWEGDQPVLESIAADGTVHNPNRVRFALPSVPDDDVRSKDRNILQLPPFDPEIDLSWVGKPGDRFPAALGWETPTQRGHRIAFDAPPEGIKPESLRLSLQQHSGPSWMELFEYRPGGYQYTKRLISTSHPWFHNHRFEDDTLDLDPTWAFGAPGQYSATFLFYAETTDGAEVVSNPATLDWDVTAGAPVPAPTPTPAPEPTATPTPDPSSSPDPSPSSDPAPSPDPGTTPAPTPDEGSAPAPGDTPTPSPAAPDSTTPTSPGGSTPGTADTPGAPGASDAPGAPGASDAPAGPGTTGSDGGADGSDAPSAPAADHDRPGPGGPGGGLPPVPLAEGGLPAAAFGMPGGAVTLAPGVSSPELLAAAGGPTDVVQVPAAQLAAPSVGDGSAEGALFVAAADGWPAAGETAPGEHGGTVAVSDDGSAAVAEPPAQAPWWRATAQGPAPAWTEQVPAAVRPAAVAVASVDVWAWALSGLALLAAAGFTGLFAARRRDRAEALSAPAAVDAAGERPADD